MLKVVDPSQLESLSVEAIENLSQDQMRYVEESELLRRHLDIQQKIFQKTKYRKDDKEPSTDDPFEALSRSISQYKQLNDTSVTEHETFERKVRSLYITTDDKNLLIDLHNTATNDEYYGERLYYALNTMKDQQMIKPEEVNQLYVLSLEWPQDIYVQSIG